MPTIDPRTKFTGGLRIQFNNPQKGPDPVPSHLAMENQPLSAFVEAALTERGVTSRNSRLFNLLRQLGN